jgi:hypothetical protein
VGDTRYLSEQDILELWQEEHQLLPQRLKRIFLAHPSLGGLTRLPAHLVEKAITTSPKLREILRETRRLFEADIVRLAERVELQENLARRWGISRAGPSSSQIRARLKKPWG